MHGLPRLSPFGLRSSVFYLYCPDVITKGTGPPNKRAGPMRPRIAFLDSSVSRTSVYPKNGHGVASPETFVEHGVSGSFATVSALMRAQPA